MLFAFCFPFTLIRLEGGGVEIVTEGVKEVEVDDARGWRYGTGGTGEGKLPLMKSEESTANRLTLRFFIIRGIIFKLKFDLARLGPMGLSG